MPFPMVAMLESIKKCWKKSICKKFIEEKSFTVCINLGHSVQI